MEVDNSSWGAVKNAPSTYWLRLIAWMSTFRTSVLLHSSLAVAHSSALNSLNRPRLFHAVTLMHLGHLAFTLRKTWLHECVCLSRTKFCLIRWEGKKQLVLSDRPLWHMHIIFEFVACIPLPCTLATQGGLQLLAACIMRWSKSRTGYDIFGILDLHPSVQFPKMHSGAPAETCFLCKTHHTIWAALLLCGKSPGPDLSLWVHACITLVGFSEV